MRFLINDLSSIHHFISKYQNFFLNKQKKPKLIYRLSTERERTRKNHSFEWYLQCFNVKGIEANLVQLIDAVRLRRNNNVRELYRQRFELTEISNLFYIQMV